MRYAGLSTDVKPNAPINSVLFELDTNKVYYYTGVWNEIGTEDYDAKVKGIAHRGFSSVAPENTLPAYVLAREKGFRYGECDVSFTKDGIPVLLHDSTINRTSNGSGNINDLTFEQVREYDFGSWKSSAYTGTKIPSFEEFIVLCQEIGLKPYIEIKNSATYTEAQVQGLMDTVKEYGVDATWISFSATYLAYVKNYDESARIGYVVSSISSSTISTAQSLQTGKNEVFIDSSSYGDSAVSLCSAASIPLEIWTIDSEATIKSMSEYITGVTSNSLIAGKVLQN